MNTKDDQSQRENSCVKASSEPTHGEKLTEEKKKVCKEIGQILSQVGDDLERAFTPKHVVFTVTP
jgi:hypothetical protein